jgi:hypothetical protein
MGLLALIDADSIIFNCGFAVERARYYLWECGTEDEYGPLDSWDKKKDIPSGLDAEFVPDGNVGKTFYHGKLYITRRRDLEPLENCLQLVKQKICGILKATSATDYKIYIKGKGNFRDEIAVTRKYKGNRDQAHRPTYEQDIRLYLKQVWGAEEVDGYEVDDQVAMLQWNDYQRAGYARGGSESSWKDYKDLCTTIIASIDKDLDQVPGWHYSYNKAIKYWVSELEAQRNFWTQMLVGDSSDNIVGIEGVGKKGAEKLLKDCTTAKEMWEVVAEQYHKAYGERASDMLCEQGRLLHLLRHPNDKWEPPTGEKKEAA